MIGRTISHYKILEKIGEGGMGVVYKAQDTRLDRVVALKFLSPRAVGSEEDRARFVHEAKAAAALSHPNICTVHEIDEAEGQSFIAMEYIEGRSLKDRIASGPLKLHEAVDIAVQVAEASRSRKHLVKAIAYEEKGDLKLALEEAKTSTEIMTQVGASDGFNWVEEYARLPAKAGDFAEAEKTAEALGQNIEKSDKNSMYVYKYAVGCIAFARGNFDEAIVNLQEAVAGHPEMQIRYMLARSYLESGRLGDAVAMFQKLLSRYDSPAAFFAPWGVKAHYFLGAAYEKSGWTAEAIAEYEAFLEIWKDADPGIPEIEDARRRLNRLGHS